MSATPAVSQPPPLEQIKQARKRVQNVNAAHKEGLSKLEALAVFINDHVGTPGFFFIIILWTILWLGWNIAAPKEMRFDPYPAFVMWLFLSNCLQIFLMPLIMVAENLQDRHSEIRAENDYEINIRAEREIEYVFQHLEYQNAVLRAMVEKLGISLDEAVKKMEAAAEAATPSAAQTNDAKNPDGNE
jgi:uncharacterized membrane protein